MNLGRRHPARTPLPGGAPCTDISERAGGAAEPTAGELALRPKTRELNGTGLRTARATRPADAVRPAPDAAPARRPDPVPPAAWERLRRVAEAPAYGRRAKIRLISCRPADPTAKTFDVLRTRLLRALQDHGWSRVAITSPTGGCGNTFTAANLALSLSRLTSVRTLLMDMNLHAPGLAKAFDVRRIGAMSPMLAGEVPPEKHLFRIGANLALGLNGAAVDEAAAVLQHPRTWQVLDRMQAELMPDVTIHDMPPMLGSDDVEAFLPMVDGVLLVADGTRTTGAEITECERLLVDRVPLIGVVLNRGADAGVQG